MTRKILNGLAVSLVVAGAGYVGAQYNETMHRVDQMQCPIKSEDSCRPDYIGQGTWVLRPQRP
jgi:hypothetical protein